MSTDQTTDTPLLAPAVVGPVVERVVRPLVERLEAAAHAWENSLTVCGDYMPSPAMLREAKAEIERLRALLATPASECTHQCLRCMHKYAPDGANEDCPVCGHDGTAA